MTASFPLHLIPLLPLLGAAFALLFGRRVGKELITLTSLTAVAASAAVAFTAVYRLAQAGPSATLTGSFFDAPWIAAGDLNVSAGLMLDRLNAVLVLIITGIGFLIHLYSTAYMEHDEGYTRFFGYLNMFMGAMLILVLGDSLLVTFVGWEGVGLCSYLLIGFWFDKEAYAYAGRKAFVVNRVGDFGFLLAMFLIFTYGGTLKYGELAGARDALSTVVWWGMPVAYFVGLLVLVGATGKSAQIPLYVWLPDAMAGPTPVSALIHAATMVTAGVYVVARLHVVFEIAPVTLAAVAVIGALTALFAATIGIAQRDMKKVLAYSTISQLGFMFVGVGSFLNGTSNYHAGVFHLMTHAFFKAGLFLGAGSVMHALSGAGDITRMGGLKKWLPHTRWTFLIYCLAIAGIFPFAGFWSKDAILGGVFEAEFPLSQNAGAAEVFFAQNLGHILYGVLALAAGCTAFYMFRLYFLVFEGEFRGTPEEEAHIHESPPAMTIVLWVLAAGSILSGLLGVPDVIHHGANLFGAWLAPVVPAQAAEESLGHFGMFAGAATAISLVGIGIAYGLYGRGFSPGVKRFVASFPGLYQLVYDKYRIDELYDLVIVRPIRWTALVLWKTVDAFVIDGFVNLVAWIAAFFGRALRYVQNGDPQRYVAGILVGGALLVWGATTWSARSAARFEVEVSGKEVVVTAKAPAAAAAGRRLEYSIDFGDGTATMGPQPSNVFRHTYQGAGEHKIKVQVDDPRWGSRSIETRKVVVQ